MATNGTNHKVDNSLEVDRCTRPIRISYAIASQENRKERRAKCVCSFEHAHEQVIKSNDKLRNSTLREVFSSKVSSNRRVTKVRTSKTRMQRSAAQPQFDTWPNTCVLAAATKCRKINRNKTWLSSTARDFDNICRNDTRQSKHMPSQNLGHARCRCTR